MGRRRRQRDPVRWRRALAGAALLVVSASTTTAYTSTATGAHARSGYAVSDVGFEFGPGTELRAIDFRLAPSGARSVQVRLAAGGAWFSCSVAAQRASCPLPRGTSAAGVEQIAVLASS